MVLIKKYVFEKILENFLKLKNIIKNNLLFRICVLIGK